MKKFKFIGMLLLAATITLGSCEKEGSAGPQGEQGLTGNTGDNGDNGEKGDKGNTGDNGEKGDKGSTGDKGEKGDKGATGNANVKVYTLSIKDSVWTKRGSVLYLKINAPNVLTRDVVRDWIVLVYVNSSDFTEWALLPYYTRRNIRVTSDYKIGSFSLERDQNGEPKTQSNFAEVKLVLIEPSTTSTISRKSNSHPDFSDYEAVKKHYHLD